MNKTYSVKIVEILYGDALLKFYRIYSMTNELEEAEVDFHGHKYYECHFVGSGDCIFSIEETEIPMHALQLMVIPPDIGHCSSESRANAKICVLEFDIESVKSEKRGFYAIFKHLLDCASGRPVPVSAELVRLVSTFRTMAVPVTAEAYCQCVAVAAEIVGLLFSELNQSARSDIFKTVVPSSPDFRVLLDIYICDSRYTLEKIAEALGYSKRHLSRLIYGVYGMKLSDVRNKRSREYAKWRLRNTDFSIDRIALDAGFKSAAAMRENFKKHEGITPQEYRKNHKIL